MKVLGIVGSKRKNGNTSYLLKHILESVKCDNIETDIIYLGDYNISGCIACEACKDTYKCVIKDDMQKLYPLILEADAIVTGSPTYFYNITSIMKAFIERFYCYQVFADNDRSVWTSIGEVLGGKYAVVLAICEQNHEKDMGFTAEAMSMPLEGLGYRIIEKVKILHLFKKEEALQNQDCIEQAKKAGEKLKNTLKLKKETLEKFK
ncbi:MAG: flavodoxin family protein [Acidaminobacteraceae bacterium]